MIFSFFKKREHSVLGIDIGSAEVKMVEIEKRKEGVFLKNYAIFFLPDLSKVLKEERRGSSFHLLSPLEMGFVIERMRKEAKISSDVGYFALPDFASFFTTFSMLFLPPEELEGAVQFEARKYVPLPLSSVVIDWSVIGQKEVEGRKKLEILLVAVLKNVVQHYSRISEHSSVTLKGMEVEVFSLSRIFSFVFPQEKDPVLVLDIGARSTICCIMEEGRVKSSYSIPEVAGEDLTSRLSRILNVNRAAAESLKRKEGLGKKGSDIYTIIAPLIDILVEEAKKVILEFERKERRVPSKIYLVGGSANLKGIEKYLEEGFKMPVSKLPVFDRVATPALSPKLKEELGPRLAIALGVGLKFLEK